MQGLELSEATSCSVDEFLELERQVRGELKWRLDAWQKENQNPKSADLSG